LKETTLKQDVDWFVRTYAYFAPYGGKFGESLINKFLTIYDKKVIVPIVCELLPKAKPNFKVAIIDILGFIGDEKVVPILAELKK